MVEPAASWRFIANLSGTAADLLFRFTLTSLFVSFCPQLTAVSFVEKL